MPTYPPILLLSRPSREKTVQLVIAIVHVKSCTKQKAEYWKEQQHKSQNELVFNFGPNSNTFSTPNLIEMDMWLLINVGSGLFGT